MRFASCCGTCGSSGAAPRPPRSPPETMGLIDYLRLVPGSERGAGGLLRPKGRGPLHDHPVRGRADGRLRQNDRRPGCQALRLRSRMGVGGPCRAPVLDRSDFRDESKCYDLRIPKDKFKLSSRSLLFLARWKTRRLGRSCIRQERRLQLFGLLQNKPHDFKCCFARIAEEYSGSIGIGSCVFIPA